MVIRTGWRSGFRGLFLILCVLAGYFFISGCVPEVYKQRVPVSTNPMGAEVYVDGKLAGKTPTAVDLERTESHVLTLVKEHYRQADVVIHRKKKTEEQLFKAINSGVSSGMFFKDPAMGMMSGMNSYDMQEKTGEAYELYPSAVTVDLKPLTGAEGHSHTNSRPIQEERKVEQQEGNQAAVAGSDGEAFAKGALGAAAMIGAASVGTQEKRWETSSSTSTSVRSDGTVVTKHSSSSVGVSVNPAGVMNLIDKLYK